MGGRWVGGRRLRIRRRVGGWRRAARLVVRRALRGDGVGARWRAAVAMPAVRPGRWARIRALAIGRCSCPVRCAVGRWLAMWGVVLLRRGWAAVQGAVGTLLLWPAVGVGAAVWLLLPQLLHLPLLLGRRRPLPLLLRIGRPRRRP